MRDVLTLGELEYRTNVRSYVLSHGAVEQKELFIFDPTLGCRAICGLARCFPRTNTRNHSVMSTCVAATSTRQFDMSNLFHQKY